MSDAASTQQRDLAREPLPVATARLAIGVWLVVIATNAVAVAFMIPVRDAGLADVAPFQPHDVIDLVVNVVMVTVGSLIVLRGRSRRYGWLLVAMGSLNSLTEAASEIALYRWYVDDARTSVVTDLAIWFQEAGGLLGLGVIVLALPSLFPDGRPVDRWRRPFLIVATLWVVWWVGNMLVDRPADNYFHGLPDAPDNPAGVLPPSLVEPLQFVWLALMIAGIVVSIGSVRTRWRTSAGDERQQLKWVLFALAVAGAVMFLSGLESALDGLGVITQNWLTSTGIPLAWTGVVVAIGFALLRYRLYDIDLVINRTIVYALASVAVIAVYAFVVAGVAALLPAVSDAGASLVAAAAVAVAFAPVRNRVQRRVDRRMFGRRSDPIGVIADVGTTMASSDAPGAALQAIADTVVAALKVPGASITIASADGDPRVATAGVSGATDETFPMQFQGEEVGMLTVARRSTAEALGASDRRLLENVAHYAAGIAVTVELNEALQRSRDRLVRTREEERRRLRRELHDGLGPALASQTYKLDLALGQLDTDTTSASAQLRAVKTENRDLVADIRRLARELTPPVHEDVDPIRTVGPSLDGIHADV